MGSLFSGTVLAAQDNSENLPSPPEDIIISTCEREISLRWNPGSSEDQGIYQYRIYRGSTRENISFYTIIDGTTRVYKDPNGNVNQTFYYYITAVNQYGESKPSTIVKATPSCGAVEPTPPKNLTYSKKNGNIELTWDEPFYEGGFDVHRYRIYRNTSDGDFKLIGTVISTMMNYTDKPVNFDESYKYYVTALNSIGPSEKSDVIEIKPDEQNELNMTPGLIISVILLIIFLIAIGKRKYDH